MEDWPARLSRMRNARGLTQRQVGAAFGIKGPSVAQWETGRSKPEIVKLPRLAQLYGVSLEELCGADLPIPSGAISAKIMEIVDNLSVEDQSTVLIIVERFANSKTGAIVDIPRTAEDKQESAPAKSGTERDTVVTLPARRRV